MEAARAAVPEGRLREAVAESRGRASEIHRDDEIAAQSGNEGAETRLVVRGALARELLSLVRQLL